MKNSLLNYIILCVIHSKKVDLVYVLLEHSVKLCVCYDFVSLSPYKIIPLAIMNIIKHLIKNCFEMVSRYIPERFLMQ